MMKGIAKRAATIFLALAVIFTCTPFIGDVTGGTLGAQEVYAASFPDEISLNYTNSEGTHTVRLTAEKPYFKNGMPEAYSSVTGGDYNAWYDPSDHTLVLKDFDGNGIDERTGNADLTILLVGDNKIDTVGQSGLAIEGSIYITSTSGGKLAITNHSSYGNTFGIWARSDGDVYIYGSAIVDVTVDNTNTSSTSGCSGIHGYGNVEIRDHAKVSVRCTSTSPSSDSWGIYASKGLTISTDQPVDVSVKNDKDSGRVHGLHANGGDITISKTPSVTINLSANRNNDIYVCSRISSLESSLDAIDYYGAKQESVGHILYTIGPKAYVPEVISIQFDRTNLQRLTPDLTGADVAAYFFPSIQSPHGATCPEETPEGWYIRMGDMTGFGNDMGDPRDMETSTSDLEWYEPYYFSFEILTDPGHKWNPNQAFMINGSNKDVIVSGAYEADGKMAYQVGLMLVCEDNLNRAQMGEVSDVVYSGTAYMPDPVLTYDDETLVKGDHYSLSYTDLDGNAVAAPTDAGNYRLTATGEYAFYGTLSADFAITPAEIKAEDVSGITDQTYTGAAIKPAPTVIVDGKTLVKDTDYTVTYKNNVNAGNASVTITGKGNYTGTITKTFQIKAAPVVKKGWVKEGGYWYFYDNSGNMVKSTWKKDSKGWCYLGADGKMVANGWAKDSKGWVWMNGSGYWDTRTRWIKYDGGWYHTTNGYRDQNKWRKDSKGWCYLGSNGRMVTNGWAKDSKGWCWMGSNGYWTSNKWVKDNGEWYYIKSNHYMASNEWAKDSGGWMYMAKNGKITKSKWVKSGGYWYYLKANGYMATGTQKIDGKTYRFDSSGRWID